ncbi:MAG: hypothetical protein ACTSRP_05400 [Candidatus Helarchaeota archaeon]
MSSNETHPKKAVLYLLLGITFEVIFPVLVLVYMDEIIAYLASFLGFPPFSITINDLIVAYTVIFGVIFSFISFFRGFYTKHSRKYAIYDCIGALFALVAYIVIIGFFSGAYFGHFIFSVSVITIDINIYTIYAITIVLYIISFIIKLAAITEAND